MGEAFRQVAALPDQVNDLAVILGALAALCAVIASAWTAARLVARSVKGQIVEVIDERLEPVLDDIKVIKAELHPNGGNSLRDRVDDVAGAIGLPPATHDPTRGQP